MYWPCPALLHPVSNDLSIVLLPLTQCVDGCEIYQPAGLLSAIPMGLPLSVGSDIRPAGSRPGGSLDRS